MPAIGPYISVTTPVAPTAPALPVGTELPAVVEKVLPDSRYLLNVRGQLLEVTLPYLLQARDALSVRIRDLSPTTIHLDVSLPAAAAPGVLSDAPLGRLVQSLGLPADTEHVSMLREFLRQGAPIERDTLSMAVQSSQNDPARRSAAAFLASNGIEPRAETVELLARLDLPPAPTTAGAPPSSDPVLSGVTPSTAEEALRLAAGASPLRERDAALQRLLNNNPALQNIDRALALLEQATASGERLPIADAARRAMALLQQLQRGESPAAPWRESAEVLREVRSQLLEQEQTALKRHPELTGMRTLLSGPLSDPADRLDASRAGSRLLQLQGEPVVLLDVPIRSGGTEARLPVRIERRTGGKNKGESPTETIVLDTELTRLGRVRTRIDAVGRNLGISLSVRDPVARDHLARGIPELLSALRDAGFEGTARMSAELPPLGPRLRPENPETPYTQVDVQA